ncbi:MAG: hypothetical protein H0X42_01590 [Solirubrobacterales bacterium]|nr:hypothetical protein [Solirubrobacterales bacterium]
MTEPTKANRSAAGKKAAATRAKKAAKRSTAAKKAAATRATSEAKDSGNDLKRAAAGAAKAGVGVGRVAIGAAGKVGEAVAKRVGAVKPRS